MLPLCENILIQIQAVLEDFSYIYIHTSETQEGDVLIQKDTRDENIIFWAWWLQTSSRRRKKCVPTFRFWM